MKSLLVPAGYVALTATAFSGTAYAQTFSTVVSPVMTPEYARDRNVSVRETPNPDYDALGVRISSFVAYPSIAIGVGGASNVYLNDGNKKQDVFASVQPSIFVRSDWSRHRLTFQASDESRRYRKEAPRNQDAWYSEMAGALELGDRLSLSSELQVGRFFESPFASEATANEEVLSNYMRYFAKVQAVWTGGRIRLSSGVDRSTFRFNRVNFANGLIVDQAYRNRTIDNGFVQAEYALSPSLASFVQFQLNDTSYDLKVSSGAPSRDGNGQRAIVGLQFDWAGVMRGTFGVGYSRRDFKASAYPSVSGFSAQGKVDFFLSPLTTITASGQRVLQDSSLGGTYAFFDTRFRLQLDHALRRNIILSPSFEHAVQSYEGLSQSRSLSQFSMAASCQLNRNVGIRLNAGYAQAAPHGAVGGTRFSEISASMAITFRL